MLLENLLRNEDGRNVTQEQIRALAAWDPGATPDREVAFTLDVAAHRFTVDDGRATRSLDEALDITLETARSELGGETVGAIRFFPDGSSTGGRVTLALGERDYHIDVDWLTGRVSIRD